jgi:hypothetical protein
VINKQSEYIDMFIRFVGSERRKIDIDKWCTGCEIKKDPGNDYIIDWINKNAIWFRNAWEISDCKTCKKWENCGWKAERNCKDFS